MSWGSIHLSRDVSLPLDAVTQTFAVLGKRGSGKTNTASVLFEQFVKAGLPAVYVDPIGVTWGLRHSRDGKSAGLPVIILGGEHADVPLEETGGAVIADFVIEHRQPVVLDLGLFSKGAQRRFMVDFAERLYHKNRDALHVMLDECDTFVPQKIDHGAERLVGAINDLVRKGRARGIGVSLISQRPAIVNKDVLTQVETLVAHRMTAPQDRDAIDRWIEHNGDGEGKRVQVISSLQELEDGEAWIWSPSWLKRLTRTRMNLRETFDSSATPKAGERTAAPKRAAEVDLGVLREQLAATIEKAKADDPRELKRRIAELERQIKAKPNDTASMTKEQERELAKTRELVENLREEVSSLKFDSGMFSDLEEMFNDCRSDVANVVERVDKAVARLSEFPPVAAYGLKWNGKNAEKLRGIRQVASIDTNKPTAAGPGESMPSGQRRILLALARHGACSKVKLAILTRYASNGGGFNNNLSALRTAGRIDGTDPIKITQPGLNALGGFDPLPDDPEAIFREWLHHPEMSRAHKAIMMVLKEEGRAMSKEDIAAKCTPPYEPGGGGFNNALSRLRTLGIIEGKTEIELSEQLRG